MASKVETWQLASGHCQTCKAVCPSPGLDKAWVPPWLITQAWEGGRLVLSLAWTLEGLQFPVVPVHQVSHKPASHLSPPFLWGGLWAAPGQPSTCLPAPGAMFWAENKQSRGD